MSKIARVWRMVKVVFSSGKTGTRKMKLRPGSKAFAKSKSVGGAKKSVAKANATTKKKAIRAEKTAKSSASKSAKAKKGLAAIKNLERREKSAAIAKTKSSKKPAKKSAPKKPSKKIVAKKPAQKVTSYQGVASLAKAEKGGGDAFMAELKRLGNGRTMSKADAIALAQKRLSTKGSFKTKKSALDAIKTDYITGTHHKANRVALNKMGWDKKPISARAPKSTTKVIVSDYAKVLERVSGKDGFDKVLDKIIHDKSLKAKDFTDIANKYYGTNFRHVSKKKAIDQIRRGHNRDMISRKENAAFAGGW